MPLMILVSVAGATTNNSTHIYEECGNWLVGFDWPDENNFSISVSHAENDVNKVKIYTDTLTFKSVVDPDKTVKVGIMRYSKWDSSIVEQSYLKNMANSTLKSSSCKESQLSSRIIDGKQGIFANGSNCRGDKMLYFAVYPLSGSGPAVTASVLATIVSYYDQDSTLGIINSMHIEEIKKSVTYLS
jgi:hypothetical protein